MSAVPASVNGAMRDAYLPWAHQSLDCGRRARRAALLAPVGRLVGAVGPLPARRRRCRRNSRPENAVTARATTRVDPRAQRDVVAATELGPMNSSLTWEKEG
ncbi:hypothetical protein HPB50_028026 [Hyalomma asiaticum]|nr:hypothetical protein HPB50_028026 [Hyalomma asiaticum]